MTALSLRGLPEWTGPEGRCHAAGAGFSWRELLCGPWLVMLVSASLLTARMFHLAHFPYLPMTAEAVAYGYTEAPFHLRMLAPMLARGLLSLTGIGAFLHWNLLVQGAFVFAALLTVYRFLRLFYERQLAMLGLATTPMVMLWSMDMPAADAFPQVFFFALAFVLLYQRRLLKFLFLFIVAVTNRETFAILLLPYVVQFWKAGVDRRRALFGTFLMIAWVFIWKLVLGPMLSPAAVTNKIALFQLASNGARFLDWTQTLNPFAKNPFTILGYTWLLLPFAWRRLDPFLKMLCACWIPYFFLMLVVAKITETRVHMEWTALAIAVAVKAIQSNLQGRNPLPDGKSSSGKSLGYDSVAS